MTRAILPSTKYITAEKNSVMKSDSKKRMVNRKFRKLDREARIRSLLDAGYLDEEASSMLLAGEQSLTDAQAEHMIENVIGVFALPQGVAINFPLNNQHFMIPMVVEEPSVVAALSYSALLAEKVGGFMADADQPLIYGQIQLVDIPELEQAEATVNEHAERIIALANSYMPSMVARGGGAREVRVRPLHGPNTQVPMLVVDIAIDTRDAMGANLVNTVCEALAPELETLLHARAVLKILSNLADQALARAQVSFPAEQLAVKGFSGEEVRDRIVLANEFSLADPYRATTHNKGIFNGIDAVAIATGNDWRSIEAAAHAYAARDGQYRALTRWQVDEQGALRGDIELPMKVGTVGGSLQSNPAVRVNQSLLGLTRAQDLAALLAAVGLAQNFAALRALAGSGIQQGHMTLHARSVALSAGTPLEFFDQVVKQLVAEGEIKVWRAQELIEELEGR